jgi:hypothetical protein
VVLSLHRRYSLLALAVSLAGCMESTQSSIVSAGVSANSDGTVAASTEAVSDGYSSASIQGATVIANGQSSSSIRVTLKNASNRAIAAKTIALHSSRGGVDSISPSSGVTDANGAVVFAVRSSTAGTPDLEVRNLTDATTLDIPIQITFVAGPPSRTASTATVSAASGVFGTTSLVLTVTLRDTNGNAVPSKAIAPVSSRPTQDGISPAHAATDASGRAFFTLTSTSAGASTYTSTDTSDGVQVASQPSVTWSLGSVSSTTSTLAISPATIAAGQTATVTLTARDVASHVLSGGGLNVTLTRATTAGQSAGTLSAVTDHHDGTYTATYTAVVDGAANVITAGGDIPVSPTLSASVTVNSCDGAVTFDGGTGTAGDPYLISTVAQLQNVHCRLNKSFRLTANLDLTGVAFSPIGNGGTGTYTYSGTFDGDGHSVAHWTLTSAFDNLGFFGGLSGTVHDLTLASLNAHATGTYTGGLAGRIEATGVVQDVTVTGAVSGVSSVGGVAGASASGSSLTDVTASAVVTGSGGQVGGAVGAGGGSFLRVSATGSVSGGGSVGGLVGLAEAATFSDCSASGTVSGASSTGGLIGYLHGLASPAVTRCQATGAVSGVGTVGGLVGNHVDGAAAGAVGIQRSFATGSVTATGDYVGGLLGASNLSGENVAIEDSYATGAVTAPSATTARGGLMGYLIRSVGTAKVISRSYSTGSVNGTGAGLSNFVASAWVEDSFWDTQTSGQAASSCGTGQTTANMKTAATFTGAAWSSAIWNLVDGSYPSLK